MGTRPSHHSPSTRRQLGEGGNRVLRFAAGRDLGAGVDAPGLGPLDHDAGPAPLVGHDEVLGRVVADVDETVALRAERLLDPLVAQGVRLGEFAAAERMRIDDFLEVRRDAQRRHLLGLHVVRAVGDQPELGPWGEMVERPAGVVEQRQRRLVVR